MPSWIEFRLAFQGAIRVARFNSDFFRFFDTSPRGALRSFWVALPLYPYYLLQIWPVDSLPAVPDMTRYVVTMSLGYLYLYLLPPCVLTWVAPLINRRAEMAGCIAIYNWIGILWPFISLPVLVLSRLGAPDGVTSVMWIGLIIVMLVWEVFLLIHALKLNLWQAGVATLADFFVMQRVVLPLFYTMATSS